MCVNIFPSIVELDIPVKQTRCEHSTLSISVDDFEGLESENGLQYLFVAKSYIFTTIFSSSTLYIRFLLSFTIQMFTNHLTFNSTFLFVRSIKWCIAVTPAHI